MILWRHAFRNDRAAPFEISEVAPEVEKTLQVDDRNAERLVGGLLKELERMPEGKQYFRREGNAVVPLPELLTVPRDPGSEFAAYPYEL
jgi:hypothetical protein